MAVPMVRKQVYLAQGQNEKLKALAAQRGCTESELIRDVVDQLPNPGDGAVERLSAAGILAPKPARRDVPRGPALAALESWFERWLKEQPAGLRLSDAVAADRADR